MRLLLLNLIGVKVISHWEEHFHFFYSLMSFISKFHVFFLLGFLYSNTWISSLCQTLRCRHGGGRVSNIRDVFEPRTAMNRKWPVFLFNLSSQSHLHCYLLSRRNDYFENLSKTPVLTCEMFISGLCPRLKNVACLSSLFCVGAKLNTDNLFSCGYIIISFISRRDDKERSFILHYEVYYQCSNDSLRRRAANKNRYSRKRITWQLLLRVTRVCFTRFAAS